MNIGMTLPVMEPDLSRKDLENWTLRIDAGPWSHIALGERILFPNPEFISTLSAVAAWTKRVEIIATMDEGDGDVVVLLHGSGTGASGH